MIAAVDRSPRAESVIREGKRLADANDVDLHIVHVGGADLPNPKGGYDTERTNVISKQKAAGVAREIGQDILTPDAFEAVGLQGDPAAEILEHALETDAEYIVVSARKRSPFGQAVFGSVTQSLLLNAECPVVGTPHQT